MTSRLSGDGSTRSASASMLARRRSSARGFIARPPPGRGSERPAPGAGGS
jgi:hypothetical protein